MFKNINFLLLYSFKCLNIAVTKPKQTFMNRIKKYTAGLILLCVMWLILSLLNGTLLMWQFGFFSKAIFFIWFLVVIYNFAIDDV